MSGEPPVHTLKERVLLFSTPCHIFRIFPWELRLNPVEWPWWIVRRRANTPATWLQYNSIYLGASSKRVDGCYVNFLLSYCKPILYSVYIYHLLNLRKRKSRIKVMIVLIVNHFRWGPLLFHWPILYSVHNSSYVVVMNTHS